MPDHRSLVEAEQATRERVQHLPLDYGASHALLSLYRAANSVRSHLTNSVLGPNDLTWTGFLVLWNLWIWNSMETREVADSVGISKGTLTGVAKTLASRGLIDRIPSTMDRRLVSLELTPSGVALMERIYPEFNKRESQVVSDLSHDELTAMTQALRTIVETSERV